MPLGVYISVPFCRTKCSYCNFASDVFSRALYERYVGRVCADIENACQIACEVGGKFECAVDSIYLGGGTPTVLEAPQLQRIFVAVRLQFEVAKDKDAELTVECAPGTLSESMVDCLVGCGVNRISLGVQSFVDREAAAVGRLHKRETVLEDIARLRAAGITNINVDLIAGLPHQTAESWEFSLNETIGTGVPHVSVYMLEVDADSRLGGELMTGGPRYHAHFVPEEDAMADFYLAACERLCSSGIVQYEISNFARRSFESQHNMKYWRRQPYLGFGVDAHSMLTMTGGDQHREGLGSGRPAVPTNHEWGFGAPARPVAVRFATSDSLDHYINGAPLQRTSVSERAALEESFMLGFRLTRGVDLCELAATFGEEAIAPARATTAELAADGLLECSGDIVRLTSRGRLLSNEVFERFITANEVIC